MKTEQLRSRLWRWRYLLILTILALFTGASTIAFAGLPTAAAPSRPTAPRVQPHGKSLPTSGAHGLQGPRSRIAVPLRPGDRVPPPSALQDKAKDEGRRSHDAPNDVLYDQYDHLDISAVTSQNFEAQYGQYDSQGADDFVVPGGTTWLINEVDVAGVYAGSGRADSVNVFFYASAGYLPGDPVYTATNILPTSGLDTGDFAILLDQPAALTVGTYWVSVQANERLNPNGQWFWRERYSTSYNQAAWRNPGGGFFTPCTSSWGRRDYDCGIGWGSAPDQVFRLMGTTPTSPTSTPTDTVTGTPPTATETSTPATPSPTNTEAATVPIPVTTAVATVIQNTPTPQPACGLLWRLLDSPNPSTNQNSLYGLTTISATDIWAVGSYYDAFQDQIMLTMHWDGTTWTVVPVSAFAQGNLSGVTAMASDDVWAVGAGSLDGNNYNGVIVHWDGSAWT